MINTNEWKHYKYCRECFIKYGVTDKICYICKGKLKIGKSFSIPFNRRCK